MASEKPGTVHNLTEGSVGKKLLTYATPLIISNFLQALYGMADMIIAGHFIGSNGLSAINNASQVSMLITSIAMGLGTGGSIVIGQYFGAGEKKGYNEVAGTLFATMATLGAVTMVLLLAFGRQFLSFLGAPSLDDATTYLRICALGMIPIFSYNSLSSILRSVGNSRQPFLFIAVAAVTNIALDLLFVGGLNMGTAGAAYATIIAQVISFLLALVYVIRHPVVMEFTRANLRIRGKHLRLILKLGIPTMVQQTVASFSWLTVTSLLNSYGVVVSAGNGISAKIKDMCQLFISAMAGASSTMIAQNLGAQLYDRAKKVTVTTIKITLSMAVVLIAVVQLFAPSLARIFTSNPEVINAAVLNLRIEIIGQVFYALFLVYHALAIGAGHTTYVLLSSFVNCILFRVILAHLFNGLWGLPGVYLACMIAPSISVPMGMIYMRSGIWRRSLARPTPQKS